MELQEGQMSNVINQNNNKNSNQFNINIKDFYNSFIKTIDGIRSKSNIFSTNIKDLNNLDYDKIISITKLVKPESTPQESRYHAFCRWIGFPVVAKDKVTFYNPGYDSVTKKLSDKITIANKTDQKFRDISKLREDTINDMLKIFSVEKSLDAGVLSLSSGVNIRKFAYFSNIDPFEFDKKNQTYKIDLYQAGIEKISLLSYQDPSHTNDSDNLSSSLNDLLANRYHYIKPFFVDPRIDFTISPSWNKIAVPFVPNNSYTHISEGKDVFRPLIEQIINSRFSYSNTDKGTSQTSIDDFINTVSYIKDESLINKVKESNGDLSIEDKKKFIYFFNLIDNMIDQLIKAQDVIKNVQGKYYWIPIPDSIGPEGGVTSRPLFISNKMSSKFQTDKDKQLINAYLANQLSKYSKDGNKSTGTPDVLNYGVDVFNGDFSSKIEQSSDDLAKQNFDTLNTDRTKVLNKACEALQLIEMIMGEYSGLGLCDILAIMGALYIMPKDNLLGFLDDDAFDRMVSTTTLKYLQGKTKTSDRLTIASTSFIQNLLDFYNLMDRLYSDRSH